MNKEQKNSNAFDDAIRDEIIVTFVLSWVYVNRAWQASSFVTFYGRFFDMSSSCAGIPEVIRIHSSEMIHPSAETYPRVFPFAAVGDAYTNISLNASEESWPSDESNEWLRALSIFFFFPPSSSNSPARLRANKHSRRVCENWSQNNCFAK